MRASACFLLVFVCHPALSVTRWPLDGSDWTAKGVETDGNLLPVAIRATVPGDIITDLQRAGMIGDPYKEMDFLNASLWGPSMAWTYEKSFVIPATGATQILVFEGIKTAASIRLNGQLLGYTSD